MKSPTSKFKSNAFSTIEDSYAPLDEDEIKVPEAVEEFILPSSTQEAVEEFFHYSPPTLERGKRHTGSPSTRAPSLTDKHLHDELILYHVHNLPSIVDDLTELAGEALKQAHEQDRLPHFALGDFPTPETRHQALLNSTLNSITCEHDVQSFYKVTTATHCSVVASTLEFHLPDWKSDYLEWSDSPVKQYNAIPDGTLRVNLEKQHSHHPPLPETYKEVANTFPIVAIWEFKSLVAGDRHAMNALVRDFADCTRFPWEGCEFGDLCMFKHSVGTTGFKMGFDAKQLPCKSVKIARDHRLAMYGPQPGPVNIKEFTQHPRHILQQAWAEAVADDVTYIVIQSGNLEIICIRDRTNRTMYISDVVEVDNCKYGKLHTGLFIAAIRDAKDRAVQLRVSQPLTWTRDYSTQPVPLLNTDKPSSHRTNDLQQVILNQACSRDWLVMTPSTKKHVHPASFLPDSLYIRIRPDSIHDTSQSVHLTAGPDLQSYFQVHVHDSYEPFVARGLIEVAGNRFEGIEGIFSETIFVKNAHSTRDIVRLKHEYQVYLDLEKARVSGVPKVIGLFRHANVEKRPFVLPFFALLLEDVGDSVAKRLEVIKKPFVSRPQLNRFQDILFGIHATGYIHGKLTTNNLIIKGPPESLAVFIISFGDSIEIKDRSIDEDEEMIGRNKLTTFTDELTLISLLPSPLRRKASDIDDLMQLETVVDGQGASSVSWKVIRNPRKQRRRS